MLKTNDFSNFPPPDAVSTELQDFIRAHELEDEKKLVLKHKLIHGIPSAWVAVQIAGRRKAREKLPSWYATENIIYPPSVNLEQCSSEVTATFKVEMLKQNLASFSRAADLTGGFGVDAYLLSQLFDKVDYVEPDSSLFGLAKHNHSTMASSSSIQYPASSIQHHHAEAEDFLASTKNKYDLLYVDPSRRSISRQKLFRFSDCHPDITTMLPHLFERAGCLLIKASPLIDLRQGVKELQCVEKIYVVAVNNECKEVLFFCQKGFTGEAAVHAYNLPSPFPTTISKPFTFFLSEEKETTVDSSPPLAYLFEPDAAILKAGAFKLIARQFGLKKISPNTHLYTSDSTIKNFPGRTFSLNALIKPDKKETGKHFPDGKANVMTRNYPLAPDALRIKCGLTDGGDKFLIGFSGPQKKFLAVATRVL